MTEKKGSYSRGKNPKSLANLPQRKEVGRKGHYVVLSDEAWENLKAIALENGISEKDGVSGLMEAIGKRILLIQKLSEISAKNSVSSGDNDNLI